MSDDRRTHHGERPRARLHSVSPGSRWTTAGVVLGVAAVAAVASYEHTYELVRVHGESGGTAHVVPLTVDGLICS